ncbi:CHAT domain-containing protein [Actinomadura terrae]|uniref:CHAT domain-containing protein n=1 Tax=Actinomadura terrae TaxID=604353 RepID=UPI001FA7D3D6|nr:CHAT domain-containing protein [Actinomadura terrae]
MISRLNKALAGQKLQRPLARPPRPTTGRRPAPPADRPEPVALAARPSALTDALPTGTARLTVTRDHSGDTEVFGLTGACCCGIELPYTAPRTQARPPRLSLGSLITPEEGGESPSETWKRLRSWSIHLNERLHGWLAAIRRAHGADLRLIILDLTDYDLPWELLWLTEPPEQGWMGALVTVTRSTTAVERRRLAEPPPETCKGDVAAYINKEMRADRRLLDHLSARIWDDSLDGLFLHLDQPGDPVALVYIACHGEYPSAEPSGAKIRLRDGPADWDVVTVRDIDARTFRRISSSRSVVFLNACHSGRQAFDPELDDATLRGFAEVFLRSGASGFIGTLGAVGMRAGHEAGRDLVAHVMRPGNAPIATALRDYRRRIAATAPEPSRGTDTETARRLFPFFYAFMYVYYGYPDTVLELRSREAGEP